MSGSAAPSYRVLYPESTRVALRDLGQRAKQLGAGAEFASITADLDKRLHADPLAVGEPLYFLRNLGLQVRVVANQFFYLHFAVDEDRRLVHVTKCASTT